MGVHARDHGGRLAAMVATAALIVSGGFVQPLLTAGPAAAAVAPPAWNRPAEIPGTSASPVGRWITIASDGTAVAVWRGNEDPDDEYGPYLYVSVRPPHQRNWSAPRVLSSDHTPQSTVRLVSGTDGSVTVLWAEHWYDPLGESGPADLVAATLAPGTSTWSKHALVKHEGASPGKDIVAVGLAAGPRGTLTAVWESAPNPADAVENTARTITTASQAADGTWSAPVDIDIDTDADGRVGSPDVTVDASGTAVIGYLADGADGRYTVKTVTRPGPAAAWGAPVVVSAPGKATRGPNLGSGPDGSLAMTWLEGIPNGTAEAGIRATVRRTGAADWGPVLGVPANALVESVDAPEPLIAPDGDVTLAWQDWSGDAERVTSGVSTATLTAGSGTWAKDEYLDLQGRDTRLQSAAIGPDGTVRVLWEEDTTVGGVPQRVLGHATRTTSDNAWTAPAVLPGSARNPEQRYGAGENAAVAAGTGGSAAAIWRRDWQVLHTSDTLASLAVTGSAVPATAVLGGKATGTAWAPVWTLNRPVSSWSVTLTDAERGEEVRTFGGSVQAQKITAAWNGRTNNKAITPNGPLTWTLKATPAGGTVPIFLASGAVTMSGGAAVFRDYGAKTEAPDGTGDIMSVNGTSLRTAYGHSGIDNFSGSVTTTGWPKGFRPVPMGDMNGDRCNDTLIRFPDGEMRRYTPACGAALKPTTSHKVLGKGWNAYDIMTSPGDVNKDGRPDLVARDPKTGVLYLYTTTASGILAPRVSLGSGFKDYKKIVGAGGGGLLLQDKGNELWRMNSDGSGKFGARSLRAENWGASYNAVVNIGDLTGDHVGRGGSYYFGDESHDLVARDTSGTIWRIPLDDIMKPVRIGTGWQVYTGGIH
ncbi:hypothetical protein ACWCQL_09235 [Streptomyces sp. NPDC002073]